MHQPAIPTRQYVAELLEVTTHATPAADLKTAAAIAAALAKSKGRDTKVLGVYPKEEHEALVKRRTEGVSYV